MGVRGGESIDDGHDGDGRANALLGSADGRSMVAVAMRGHTPCGCLMEDFQGECTL